MAIIEADYRVLTPMFCAGADPSRPELRAPSFKGVLRFWWRALAWARLGGDLEKIHEEEDRIFGGPAAGCSQVAVQIAFGQAGRPSELGKGGILKVGGNTGPVVGDGARYLGYGLMEAFASAKKNTERGQLLRACCLAPFNFTVRLRCRSLSDVEVVEVSRALQAAGLFGGLGARTRRGYGSITLQGLRIDGEQKWQNPISLDALGSALRGCTPAIAPEGVPPYTAFCRQTRIVVVKAQSSGPLDLLDLIGREMVRFRSWGKNGKILSGENSLKLFSEDHDLMKQPPAQRNRHPQRIAFGLPHNYGRGNEDKVEPAEVSDRRASPLFIHMHECSSQAVAVLAFLPAEFLPRDKKINVGGKNVELARAESLWKPVTDFLDRFSQEPFAGTFEVRP
jgi:CRISPR-associated protein Cmr1